MSDTLTTRLLAAADEAAWHGLLTASPAGTAFTTRAAGREGFLALYWQCAQTLREEWGAPLHINFGGSPRPSLAQFKDYLGATPTLHFRLVHDQPGPRTRWWRQARKVKETGRRVLTKGGILQAWYRAQRGVAPETTPEEKP